MRTTRLPTVCDVLWMSVLVGVCLSEQFEQAFSDGQQMPLATGGGGHEAPMFDVWEWVGGAVQWAPVQLAVGNKLKN